MWRLLWTSILLCASLAGAAPKPAPSPARKYPKLVVVIAIDQFRYDYLTRFRESYTGGFDRLLKNGAVFTNAFLEHFPTVTASGHATIVTGATPSMSGIAGNEWYDRESGAMVTSVSDPNVKLLGGGNRSGASPHRLLVSTIGDEMKMAGRGKPRVIGISLKDRAAILPSGHMADGAYWFDDSTGNFVSSTYYFSDLPGWVKEFNGSRLSDRYTSVDWRPLGQETNGPNAILFKKLPAKTGSEYYGSLEASPFGNELVESFAERAIASEQLGARDATDLLTISFSSNDHVGHEMGPHAPEVRDMSIRTDRIIEKLFAYVDKRIGLANVLVVLTADHGVAPVPELMMKYKMPGGRLLDKSVSDAVVPALAQRYGGGKWVLYASYGTVYLNRNLIREKKLDEAEVETTAAQAMSKIPHVSRVYTREQLISGEFVQDAIGRRVANGFHIQRSGDVIALLDPHWIFSGHGTTHGSAFNYDSHVPVIFMGPSAKPGRYGQNIAANDIAPTLATMLDVETPSGSVGRVLTEMLQ